MKNLLDVLFEQGQIWALIIMAFIFFSITTLQRAHENGKRWGRPLQYVFGAIFIAMFIWLSLNFI